MQGDLETALKQLEVKSDRVVKLEHKVMDLESRLQKYQHMDVRSNELLK